MSYCPVCNPNNSTKDPKPNCYYCKGSGVITNPVVIEQAKEEAYRNYEQEWRDRCN